ncbi:THAP9 [Mytilus coruscus]|uniref:THAP9 n=1 Tax=Mytilus coruscus TaxID=42192 RepID=A0A6J8A9T8_MYTCO|nr:THAP9 [Mytilus coruscus]
MQLYPSTGIASVKLNVTIDQNFAAKVFVHRIELCSDHQLWKDLPTTFDSIINIQSLLSKLERYSVRVGNYENDLIDVIPIGSAVQHAKPASTNCHGYREGHRCFQCSQLRRILVGRKYRQEEKQRKTQETSGPTDYLHSKMQHSNMSKLQLIEKIHQQKDKITNLQNQILRTRNQFQREMASKGVTLDFSQSLEIKDTMATCNAEMEKACPDENSSQRLFWTEQMKCMNLQSTKGMRWHPMILRWCLYLRQKSSAAYDALRDSGFITLPSSRTLFDYSHYTRSDNGFLPDVIKVLQEEATKRDMYSTEDVWKNYVGILFDEIKIKSDLVYDKHTGELIGYCNLDKVGNQIMDMERSFKDSSSNDIAKYMLVLMVRGVATDLKFPLAGFATLSITADFLYPIIWKAIRILETSAAQLKVLFLTCDLASANRKFFNLHGQVNDFVYFTDNPFSEDGRKIYFVADVPHLIKTTRNCFSNSFSHLNTRKLWNNGKDMSWIHLLTLFEQHCEMSLYTPCPKLTRSQLDLTPFGRMKVNLAAQVLSSTVANALEMMYGDNVSETVNFPRIIDKFFDCLNVRNLYEGRNKRNPNLNPYTNINDERLQWLTGDFLSYFDLWEQSVLQRPGAFTDKQRKDPLEQHFGHYRHRAGDNSNPTVYDVRHMMTTMRAVGAQALAPQHSNINNKENRNMVIDNSRLPKRGNYF